MKPGLSIPRFYPNDAVDAEKIDSALRQMYEQVNGGLTSQNLSPSLRLSNSSFRNAGSTFTLGGQFMNELSGTRWPLGCIPTPAGGWGDCILIGVSWVIATPASGIQTSIIISTGTGTGTNRATIDISRKSTNFTGENAPKQGMLFGAEQLPYQSAIGSGTPIGFVISHAGASQAFSGAVAAYFKFQHIA